MERKIVDKGKNSAAKQVADDSRLAHAMAFGIRHTPKKRNSEGVYSFGDEAEGSRTKRRATLGGNSTLLNRDAGSSANQRGTRARVVTAPVQAARESTQLPEVLIRPAEGEMHVGHLKNDPVMPVYAYLATSGNKLATKQMYYLRFRLHKEDSKSSQIHYSGVKVQLENIEFLSGFVAESTEGTLKLIKELLLEDDDDAQDEMSLNSTTVDDEDYGAESASAESEVESDAESNGVSSVVSDDATEDEYVAEEDENSSVAASALRVRKTRTVAMMVSSPADRTYDLSNVITPSKVPSTRRPVSHAEKPTRTKSTSRTAQLKRQVSQIEDLNARLSGEVADRQSEIGRQARAIRDLQNLNAAQEKKINDHEVTIRKLSNESRRVSARLSLASPAASDAGSGSNEGVVTILGRKFSTVTEGENAGMLASCDSNDFIIGNFLFKDQYLIQEIKRPVNGTDMGREVVGFRNKFDLFRDQNGDKFVQNLVDPLWLQENGKTYLAWIVRKDVTPVAGPSHV